MKSSYITTCIAATLLATSYQTAANDLTFYGKANVTLNLIKKELEGTEQWEINSNASRLGVKGKYAINDDITAIYKMEFEVYIDDGDKEGSTFGPRNIYTGLTGNFGTLIVGKHDTPLKIAQGKVDRFNDQLGDIKNYMGGEDRVSNIAMYTTPAFEGFSASVAVVPGEDSENGNDGVADGRSISFKYQRDWLIASISGNSDIDDQDTIRLVTEANFDDFKLGVLWQTAKKVSDASEVGSWLISGEYQLGNSYTVKGQYGMADYQSPSHGNKKNSLLVFGVDKQLNKKVKVFTYYSIIEKESVSDAHNDSALSVGFELKF